MLWYARDKAVFLSLEQDDSKAKKIKISTENRIVKGIIFSSCANFFFKEIVCIILRCKINQSEAKQ